MKPQPVIQTDRYAPTGPPHLQSPVETLNYQDYNSQPMITETHPGVVIRTVNQGTASRLRGPFYHD
jgi:hypothetical protein